MDRRVTGPDRSTPSATGCSRFTGPGWRSATSRCRRSRRSTGHAVGAGLCLALACDLRYAAAGATLSAPFTALGMHAGMAATWLLPEVVGLPVARELLFTGRRVDAGRGAADRAGQRRLRAGRAHGGAIDVAGRDRGERADRGAADGRRAA